MYAIAFLLLNPTVDGLILIRYKHWNKPTIIGRNSNLTSSPQRSVCHEIGDENKTDVDTIARCWTSEHPNDGLPNTVLENGRRYTPGEYRSPPSQISSRTYGTPNTAARWTH